MVADITKQMAERIVSIKYEDLPDKTVLMAKQFILDWLGCSIRGWGEPNIEILYKTLGENRAPVEATMLNGSIGAKNSLYFAAMLNAAASHALDFDDLHNASIIHLGTVVAPAVWSVAEAHDKSGKQMLAAVVAGHDVAARIGESIIPESYHYWHTTATVGTFAAAGAVANLMQLDKEKTIHCLGTAGTQAAGLWEFLIDGAMSKTMHIGKAVFAGILSVNLVQNGFTGAQKILEGDKGFCRAMVDDVHWGSFEIKDKNKYKIDDNSFKPYACCKHTHPANYATYLLKNKYNLTLADIDSVHIKTNSVVKSLVDNASPQNPYGSKFSIQYCVLAMIKYNKLGIEEFSIDNLKDENIQRLMLKFTVVVDDQLEKEYKERPERWSVEVTIKTKDGKTLTEFVEYPKGDPPNPMTWDESVEKFTSLATARYGEKISAKLCKLVFELDKVTNFKKAFQECFK